MTVGNGPGFNRVRDMPLGYGVDYLRDIGEDGRPCACSGGEWCCGNQGARAAALRRAAHIVARQLADLRDWTISSALSADR